LHQNQKRNRLARMMMLDWSWAKSDETSLVRLDGMQVENAQTNATQT